MHEVKTGLPVIFEEGEAFSREVEWGDMNVAYQALPGGMDIVPLFKGLPDGRCQCPHWGYVLKGRFRVGYAGHEEVINAGELYYLAPGHLPYFDEDTEVVEFSPKGEYQKTMEVVKRNMEEIQRAS